MQKDTCVWKMMYGGGGSKIFFRKWFVILRHLWWSKWTQKFFYCTISPGFDKIIIIKGGKHFRFIRLHSVFVPGRIDIDSMLGLSSCISVFGLTPLTRASVRYGGLHYFCTAFFFRCVPFSTPFFETRKLSDLCIVLSRRKWINPALPTWSNPSCWSSESQRKSSVPLWMVSYFDLVVKKCFDYCALLSWRAIIGF